ncbi:DUF3168 domain-containing protein [uncultured Roseobacter sp.]|uniref:DUF3168 domain-containing protein n=1 Tax=uncultured Roseobacter sp. TaxID=114847 RepID=UPI0026181F80|nr:DUF3168 domain-containing protein [uncultured Roseobacter sp.]
MEEELRALILAHPPVQAIADDRVYFGARPQGDPLPGVVMTTISDVEGYHMQGRNGLSEGRVQIDCYAETYGQAKLLSRAIRDLLSFYRGGRFRGIFHVGTRDGREDRADDQVTQRPFRIGQDFNTNWRTD